MLEVLLTAGAAAGAVLAVAGLLWWLVAPRVRLYVDAAVATSERATAGCTRELSRVADQLGELAGRVRVLEESNRHAYSIDRMTELADLAQLISRLQPERVAMTQEDEK